MKKHILILLLLPFIGLAQNTFVPDDNFEQELINLGYDTVLDDSVLTANINTVDILILIGKGIVDMTGIEDFDSLVMLSFHLNYVNEIDLTHNLALTHLGFHHNSISSIDLSHNTLLHDITCHNNNLTALDVSNCPDIVVVQCEDNNLTSLNLNNGTNTISSGLYTEGNPNLTCILVDDSMWSANNCVNIGAQHYFSETCGSTTNIENQVQQGGVVVGVVDVFGRRSNMASNQLLFYIFDDGRVEKRVVIE
jgi:hypothetical protein